MPIVKESRSAARWWGWGVKVLHGMEGKKGSISAAGRTDSAAPYRRSGLDHGKVRGKEETIFPIALRKVVRSGVHPIGTDSIGGSEARLSVPEGKRRPA